MAEKLFTQEELNRIVAARLKRERGRLAGTFENSIKRCMAAVHLTLHQELHSMKRDMAAETVGTLLPDEAQTAVPYGNKSAGEVKSNA